jgi:5-methylthioadenosine/S-adenosylhomocysteine deaminase
MDFLIHNGLVLTMDAEKKIFPKGALAIQGNRILEVGSHEEIFHSYPAFKRLDAQGKAILPGLVNSHSHTALSALRGMVEDGGRQTLYKIYFPFEQLMTDEDLFVMGLLGCVETLKSGTTCLVENFMNISRIVQAMDQVGLRGVVSEIVRDVDYLGIKNGVYRFDPKIGDKLLRNGVDLIEKWHEKSDGRMRCLLSPHAPDMCSAGLLCEIRGLAEKMKVGVHTHLCQSKVEVEEVVRRVGKRPAQFLEEVGLLGPQLTGAHCFWADEKEVEILGKSGTNIAHCSGIAARRGYAPPIWALKQAGANVGLGSDNMTGDMIEAMRLALMIARIKTGDSTALPSMEILEMATMNGARAVGLQNEIGSLEKGKKADLILLDLKKPHLVPVIDAVPDIVHYAIASDVDTVIVDGRIIMEGRQVKTVNEEEVMKQAQKTTERLWAEFHQKYS